MLVEWLGETIDNVGSHKDLGLIMSTMLNWIAHVQERLLKANRAFHCLKTNIPSKQTSSKT